MIEFSNVSKVYPNGVVGLDDVNLTIEQGEFVGIIGLSGAGKSTLINTLTEKYHMETGEVSDKIGRGKHTTRHSESGSPAGRSGNRFRRC